MTIIQRNSFSKYLILFLTIIFLTLLGSYSFAAAPADENYVTVK